MAAREIIRGYKHSTTLQWILEVWFWLVFFDKLFFELFTGRLSSRSMQCTRNCVYGPGMNRDKGCVLVKQANDMCGCNTVPYHRGRTRMTDSDTRKMLMDFNHKTVFRTQKETRREKARAIIVWLAWLLEMAVPASTPCFQISPRQPGSPGLHSTQHFSKQQLVLWYNRKRKR